MNLLQYTSFNLPFHVDTPNQEEGRHFGKEGSFLHLITEIHY